MGIEITQPSGGGRRVGRRVSLAVCIVGLKTPQEILKGPGEGGHLGSANIQADAKCAGDQDARDVGIELLATS
jgi:hypothetical protein